MAPHHWIGLVLILTGVAAAVILHAYRHRPAVRALSGVDAIRAELAAPEVVVDDRDDFDEHVDQAVAVANSGWTQPVWCETCRTYVQIRVGHVLEDVTAHGRTIHTRAHAADFAAWETELKRSTP